MSSSRQILIAAAALALLAAGGGAGAGIYSALAPARTTTVVQDTPSTGPASTGPASTVTTTTGEASTDAAQPVADSSSSGISVSSVFARTHKGVVDITVVEPASGARSGSPPFDFGGSGQTQAEGSGFVMDTKGDIVTNDHVVSGATRITVKLWNGNTFSAKLVGADSSTDLAVVHISAPSSQLEPLAFGNSSAVQVGDPVAAIGSPFGLPQTVTSGIVSALHRTIDSPNDFSISDSIQTDAPINHGNSGGPLLDSTAQVIGVNAQIQSQSGGSEGVGFAIPSNTVRSVVAQIVAGKTVAHAYLGVQVEDSLSPRGAKLAQVIAGAPAAKAGLRAGDVVTKLDSTTITNESDLSALIDGKRPGEKMSVTYVRAGVSTTIVVTLTSRPA